MGTIHWGGDNNVRGTIVINHYPSGEPVINFGGSGTLYRLYARPQSMLDFMGLLFFVDAYMDRSFGLSPHLILPFVPGARQDRMNNVGDYLFTAKSVAMEINLRNFRTVTIFDPHSEVISGMINHCHIVHAQDVVRENRAYFDPIRYSAIISPDAGAEKRAGAVAKLYGLPLIHGWKTRDVRDGRITGFGLEPSVVEGKVLVVDDICDGGGTFIGLAEKIKERGLRADLFVTHGIFSQGTAKLLEHYERVVCTDSIEGDKPGVLVIPACTDLFEGNVP